MKKSLRFTNAFKKIMRFSLFQLLLMVLSVSLCFAHETTGQDLLNHEISLNAQSIEVKSFLSAIENQAGVKFIFSNNAIKKAQKISIQAKSEKLALVLEKALFPLGVTYEVVGNRILLKKGVANTPKISFESPILPIIATPKVVFTLSGTITGNNNEPLVGASVILEGTAKGTVADEKGHYELELEDSEKNGRLVFSYIGFEKQTIAINGRTNIDVTLVEGSALEEVIVTGVFDKRTRMESSVAISVINTKQIERIAVNSAADLLKNVPGVFVNSSLGEIRNTVYSRGVSVGSNDGASGYFYVSMQEDGLPVTNATYGNYGPDYFLRPDATLGRMEAVRGGTASILGNNAPGGIFNYVSKTGGQSFAGELRAKVGLEGNGKNPYYRGDFNFGGPLSKDKSLTYNIGGFWRQSDGARYPGYPMNNGGQLKANLVKNLKGGSLKLYGKYLNDKNAWFEFLPTIGFDDPKLPQGVEQTHSVLIPPVTADFTINNTGEKRRYDSRDKIHSKDVSIGLNFDHTLGKGWSIDNKVRYSDKTSFWNTTAVAYPFAVDNIVWYAIAGQIGQFGNYSFKDLASGTELANVTQAPNIVNGQFAGFNFIVNKGNLPGASVQKNSVLFNPLFMVENNIQEFIDQFTITKKFKNMSFTAGLFYANSTVNRLNSTGVGVMYSQITAPRPTPTAITYTDFGNQTYQITNKDGVAGGSGKGAPTNIVDATQNQTALFFGHNWAINSKLNFDWGIRYERIAINGANQISESVNNAATGGVDGNPLTLYDNAGGRIRDTYTYDKTVSTFSLSAGLNYKFTDNLAIYGRYSEGRKAPDLDMYFNVNTDATEKFLNPIPQNTQQAEVGLKIKKDALNLFITPFYSILSNVAIVQLGQETADLTSTYATPTLYNKYRTMGIELEGIYNLNESFSVRAVATFQNSKAVDFSAWVLGQNGQADDKVQDYSGNETDNNARTILRLSPTYNKDKFFASIDWSYMGKRAANVPNAFSLPAFHQTNLNVGFNVSERLSLQANINNVFNQDGVMGWSAPGGFPAALDRQGFTKASLEANPNAVYSTLSLPPRAYFLTVSYLFK